MNIVLISGNFQAACKLNVCLPVILFFTLFFFACDTPERGCTDPNAPNYNPTAERNDGSCIYPIKEKKVLMVMFNNTDNSTCGTFGIPLFNNALVANTSKVIPLVAHPSSTDTLYCGKAVNLAAGFNQTGYPDIAAGLQTNLLTLNLINDAISESAIIEPVAGSSADMQLQGDSIIITLYAKFYTSAIGEYYVSAYLYEQNIDLPQAGIIDPSFRHNYVLRESSSTSAFGDLIAASGISDRTSFKRRYGIFKQANWNYANMRVISAIWKREGGQFVFINASSQ
ncbi:MAG: Omp28-related outer membrane protein [Candidatus Competibacteraceae bacterium]|nr:Omp28-related outer membrane protein [Candidatus Competibacteraceae bacterium]